MQFVVAAAAAIFRCFEFRPFGDVTTYVTDQGQMGFWTHMPFAMSSPPDSGNQNHGGVPTGHVGSSIVDRSISWKTKHVFGKSGIPPRQSRYFFCSLVALTDDDISVSWYTEADRVDDEESEMTLCSLRNIDGLALTPFYWDGYRFGENRTMSEDEMMYGMGCLKETKYVRSILIFSAESWVGTATMVFVSRTSDQVLECTVDVEMPQETT